MLQRVSVSSTTGLFLGAINICPNELNTASLDFHMVGVHELWHALAFVALIPRWDASLTSCYLFMGGTVEGILLVGLGVLLAVYKRMRASAMPLKSRASCKSP
jgi:hypothetical protein